MSKLIIEITDVDGDSLTVREADSDAPNTVFVKTSARHGAYLTTADVDRLREALAPYGTAPQRTAMLAPFRPVVGDTVRLLPNATLNGRSYPAFHSDVTRVRVTQEIDGDGDYRVTALNGYDSGNSSYVGAAFLAPLDAAPALAELDPRRVEAFARATEAARTTGSGDSILRFAEFLLSEAR